LAVCCTLKSTCPAAPTFGERGKSFPLFSPGTRSAYFACVYLSRQVSFECSLPLTQTRNDLIKFSACSQHFMPYLAIRSMFGDRQPYSTACHAQPNAELQCIRFHIIASGSLKVLLVSQKGSSRKHISCSYIGKKLFTQVFVLTICLHSTYILCLGLGCALILLPNTLFSLFSFKEVVGSCIKF
jgi:hypothetical protein